MSVNEWKRLNGEYWQELPSNKARRLHAKHPSNHPAYKLAPITNQSLFEAMELGFQLWTHVGNANGYRGLLQEYPDFSSLVVFVSIESMLCFWR